MRLAQGDVFAGYAIDALLGAGGMGVVYRARHPRMDRFVALKVLGESAIADPGMRARFEREAALLAGLEHPNIVGVYDHSGAGEEQLWISMRYVDGIDISRLIAEAGALAADRAVGLIGQAAAGLDYAHSRGILHRDVKPANLLVDRDHTGAERVSVTDFGIAVLQDATATGTGITASFGYAAPERFSGGLVDSRADVYSLGCTLYQMLTGQLPYPYADPGGVIGAHLTAPPPRPTAVRPDLPPDLDRVLAIAMAKNPEHRYPTCAALAEDARRALFAGAPTDRGVMNPVMGQPYSAEMRPVSRSRGRWLAAGLSAGAVVLAVLVAGTVYVVNRASDALGSGSVSVEVSRGAETSGAGQTALPATVNCAYRSAAEPAAKPVKKPSGTGISTTGSTSVTLDTSQGPIGVVLRTSESPCTVNSFVSLIDQHFYDGVACHRLTTSGSLKVLQCGDPSGTGSGGPGYAFDNEFPTTRYAAGSAAAETPMLYERGVLAMANANYGLGSTGLDGRGTNGSQFFLVYGDSQLPPQYTIFGTVDAVGLATLDRVAAAGIAPGGSYSLEDGTPNLPVTLESIRRN
ncbi:protein kinase domain-containing protein [Nocardia huaxiensis]|uniref:protein kinase domain-containing protein n=1 Tax=Nocardia huaxiensis TaxID=2755382 RepID=UPI001E3D5F7F|nr:protein kinase [Nocardia huaxiensis]UFS97313.1 protein kinase [Nocardia huaxiensis]